MTRADYATLIRALLHNAAPPESFSPQRPIDRLVHSYWLGPDLYRDPYPIPNPATEGERLALLAWQELATPYPGCWFFNRLGDIQTSSGSFLGATPSTNLETYWYWELVLLHALTSYAIRKDFPPLLNAAKRAALYHLNETQPDHATTEPWALNAFLLSGDTYSLADQLLHTTRTQHPAGVTGVSAILLADTLRCIEALP